MKRRGIVFIVLMLVLLMAATLVACDDIPITGKSPTHLSFDNPYKATSTFNPVYLTGEGMEPQDTDFNLENVKLYVEYSDGTRGEPVAVTESMLAPESTGDLTKGDGSRQAFTVQYTVKGEVVKGTFYVYTKLRTAADMASLIYYTNGGSPSDFIKKVTKGTAYSTYTQFTSSFTQVARAGHTLIGWVLLPATFDHKNASATEINQVATERAEQNKILSSEIFPTLGVEIVEDSAFCAVWEENTTTVTFNYNFARFNITSDLYGGTGMPATPVSTLYAPNSTITRPVIEDNAIPGWKFVGWYTDEALTNVRSFNQQVGGVDINLFAKWEQVFYSITFNLLGGELNNSQFIVDEDGVLYEKSQPTQVAAPNLLRGKVAKFDSNGAISRIAYTNLSYKAVLNDGGTKYHYLARSKAQIDENHYLSKGSYENTTTGEKNYYYKFAGWYRDSDYKVPYNFTQSSTVQAENLVLYAKWEIDESVINMYYENYLFKDKYIIKADGTIKITGINDLNIEKIALPNQINGKFITEIGDDAFEGCVLLSSFSIRQSSLITTIGARAFRFCTKLERVDIIQTEDGAAVDISKAAVPIKVTTVGKDAFRGTTWLSLHSEDWITIGKVLVKFKGAESVKRILPSNDYDGANGDDYYYSQKLKNVDTICADAFKGLTKLTQIVIPNSILTIEDDAFAGCKSLASITVQEKAGGGYKLTNVGASSFSETAWFKFPSSTDNNYRLYNALILGGIYYRFAGSRSITTTMATVPADISIIAPNAFQDFDNIRSIDFMDKTAIKVVGENAFTDTVWFRLQGEANEGFIIVNGIVVGYVGRGKAVTTSDGESTLVAVYVPSTDRDGVSVTKIATKAFYGYYASTINAIALPESINEIEPHAFVGATNLTVLSYLGRAFMGDVLPKIYESSFYGQTSGVLVNSNLRLYLTSEVDDFDRSLYKKAIVNDPDSALYFKLYEGNSEFIQKLENSGIRVKAGTLPSRYVNYPGWSLSGEWDQNGAFDSNNNNRAILVIMRSDGLPYETAIERTYIDNATVFSTVTTTTPHKLVILYDVFTCQFEYWVEPQISSITIDNGESENSFMSRARYFTTSTRFVYSGGYITVNYVDTGVSPLRIPLTNANVGSGKLVQISGFTVSRAGEYELKFTYSQGLQSVYTYYSYTVANPSDVTVEFYQPVITQINSTVDLTSVILKVIRDDIRDGGQIFDIGGSGYEYYFVTMKNAKVNILEVDGVVANEFDTSWAGLHTMTVKYGSDMYGYTTPTTLTYEVILETLDSWFNYDVLTTTDTVFGEENGVTIYEGTAQIKSIGKGHLPTVVIPEYFIKVINNVTYRLKVVEIASGAFENDNDIVAVYIASSVATINDKAFLNCKNLDSVIFMDVDGINELTFIDSRAFEGCLKLKTITLPNGVSEVGSYVFKGSGLVSIDLSNTAITELADNMFEYCLSLESVIVPTGLTVVGNSAFYGCTELIEINLGEHVQYIGTYAFYFCSALTRVVVPASQIPQVGAMAFGVPTSSLIIEVPAPLVGWYKAAWSSYDGNIMPIA